MAACRMDAVSVISTMNVERPACNSSLAPNSSEDAVASADRGRGRGDIRARMGEQREQRSGSDRRALTGHVRPRNERQTGLTATKFDINRNEFRDEQSIQHRMAGAQPNRTPGTRSCLVGWIHLVRAVAANVASTSISAINAAAAFKWLATALTCRMHPIEQFLFPLDGPFTGGEHFFFPSFEFFGDVAFAVPQCLLAHQCEGTLSRWVLVTSMPYPNTRLNITRKEGMSYCSESSCWYWVSQAPASRLKGACFIQFCVDAITKNSPPSLRCCGGSSTKDSKN